MPEDAAPQSPDRSCALPGAKLFRRGHIEEVQRNVWESTAESPERFGEQLEVKIGRIGDVQLAGFAPAETLHSLDTFRGQRQYASGINQESPPFFGQGHLVFGTVQETNADLPLEVMDLSRKRGLR